MANGHGGARAGGGGPEGPQPKSRERSEYVVRLENVEKSLFAEQKAGGGKSLAAIRRRMNFHLQQADIIERRIAEAGADALPADVTLLEHHLEKASEAAEKVAPFEFSKLATVKNIGRDDPFDLPLESIPDDRLDQLASTIGPLVPSTPENNTGPVEGAGPGNGGGPAPVPGEGGGGTPAAG